MVGDPLCPQSSVLASHSALVFQAVLYWGVQVSVFKCSLKQPVQRQGWVRGDKAHLAISFTTVAQTAEKSAWRKLCWAQSVTDEAGFWAQLCAQVILKSPFCKFHLLMLHTVLGSHEDGGTDMVGNHVAKHAEPIQSGFPWPLLAPGCSTWLYHDS